MKWIAILLATSTLPLAAQWLNYPEARTPRTKDGKPNLSAPAPRINGKPDLSGVWMAERTPVSELTRVLGPNFTNQQVDINDLTKEGIDVFWGLKPQEEPLRPEGVAALKRNLSKGSITSRCLPAGVPVGLFVYSFKMIQTPEEIVVLSEAGDPARQIHTDGRSLPEDPQPSWMGYSIGTWEGDKLTVHTIGFNEEGWLDLSGHPRSESTRVREQFHRRDFGHMDVEVTIEDPKFYTRPINFKAAFHLIPDSDVLEFVCAENEKDVAHTPTR